MSGHTPGPWKVMGPPAHAKHDQQGDRLIYSVRGDHICESFQYRGDGVQDYETSLANARLIAAAPELLAALGETVLALKIVVGMVGATKLDQSILDRAVALIAKVNGEPS